MKKATRVSFGEALAELGRQNDRIVALDADLAGATMSGIFQKAFPHRHFNCGIAEANMVDMASGMSLMGLIPFCSTFAVFAGRCFENIRNGICYPHANVKLAFSHAGISVGEDGGTHQSIEDIALMRVLPGMTVLCSCDDLETRKAVAASVEMEGPVYLRLARMATRSFEDRPFEIGKGRVMREGKDAVAFTCGTMVEACMDAAELLARQGIELAVINLHTIKPMDTDLVCRYAATGAKLFSVEEHSIIGGLGDAVRDALECQGTYRLTKIGIRDCFGTVRKTGGGVARVWFVRGPDCSGDSIRTVVCVLRAGRHTVRCPLPSGTRAKIVGRGCG